MSKADNKPKKHIPQRTCIGCREVNEKKTLVRIVRSPEGVCIDLCETAKETQMCRIVFWTLWETREGGMIWENGI